MRGVSEVIAIILILMITISLAGLAYMFMSTTMSDVTSSAGSTVDTTTSSMLTSFTIESMDVAKVYIRNTGQNALTSLSVYVNDIQAHSNMTPTMVPAGQIGTITIYDFIAEGDTIKVASPSGFSTSKKASNLCDKTVGCWQFDENSGNMAFDSSPNGFHAQIPAGISWAAGKSGSALNFNGKALNLGNILDISGEITITALVRPTIKPVNVLSLYANGGPACGQSMGCYIQTIASNDGLGLLNVTCLGINQFNAGSYNLSNHDVVIFDGDDCWGCGIDMEEQTALRQFVSSGGSLIGSHDSLCCGCGCPSGYSCPPLRNLVDMMGLSCGGYDTSINTIYRTKTGDITSFPYAAGSSLSTLAFHNECGGITVSGASRWYETVNPADNSGNDIALTTYFYGAGRAEKIWWGHTSQAPSSGSDESKLIVNSILWAGSPMIIAKGSSYGLTMSNSNVNGILNAKNLTSSLSSDWNFVILNYNGSVESLYVNGVLLAQQAFSDSIPIASSNLSIGSNFDGLIDDIRIYNKALY